MSKIVLIGYRGTGKSTVARLLGQRLGVPVWDSDSEIERRIGKTIAEIFAEDGEAAFRELEAEVIAELLQQESFVLATGGGAILREETRQRLRLTGHVVFLTAESVTILRRIQQDKHSAAMRPNLTSLPPLEEIVAVLGRRQSFYEETAHSIVNTEKKTVKQIVEEIMRNCSR